MKSLYTTLFLSAFSLASHAGELIYSENFSFQTFTNLEKVSEAFNLGINAKNFALKETKTSLLATHYYYQQSQNGTEVNGSQVVVSVDSAGKIIRIYNSATNNKAKDGSATIPFISKEMAIDLAWKHLQVNGDLLKAPTAKLIYSENMQLIYLVNVGTSSPFGYWNISVDAQTGKILEVADTSLPRMKRETTLLRSSNKQLTSLSSAMIKFNEKALSPFLSTDVNFVSGSAQIFDPNPVVALGRTDLNDNSDPSLFLGAYEIAELKDITFSNGVYSLTGPKTRLIDFESPYIAPTTSTNGTWEAQRGNNRFNDVMTYVHIDRSIRYIESLGFTDKRAIFKTSIEVDSDGVNSTDNSHYIPSSNRLAFGHGCVDDNEDADVILHELGHAIQGNISSSWSGGDTGAMGEGFGDYWAASYSATLPRGMDTHPEWVFKWDGHNSCWAGRKLNAFMPKYNPSATYDAHKNVDGGITDEVWSTPLFQAFLELYGRGVPKESIDMIILEAHFGLGYGVRIPTMAKSIVKTAKALFPNEDYDQVFLRHFQNQKIL